MITLYEVSKMLNSELVKNELKVVPSQMLYNYARQGLIKFEVINDKKLVRLEIAEAFITKFVSNRINALQK